MQNLRLKKNQRFCLCGKQALKNQGKSLKDFMLAFDVARATMQRDMALLKAHDFVVFEGAAKSGVYKLSKGFKLKLEIQ